MTKSLILSQFSEFFSNELATVVSLLGEDGTKGVRKMVFPSEVSPYEFR